MSEKTNTAADNSVKNNKTKKKSLAKKILLWIAIVLLVLALALTVFFIRNPHWWNHIMAVRLALTKPADELKKNMDAIQQERIEEVNKNGYLMTSEMESALNNGLIDENQFPQILMGKYSLELAIDANKALSEGKISSEQHTAVLNGLITLEAALSQTHENNPEENNISGENEKDVPDMGDDEFVKPEEDKKETVSEKDDEVPEKNSPPKATDKQNTDGVSAVPEPVNPESSGKQETVQVTPTQPKEETVTKQPVTDTAPTTPSTNTNVDERVAELITKMYVLKSTYVSQVEGLVGQMKAEYAKLPAEQRTTSAKQSIASGYMSKINAMEAQCDAQVNGVVSELRALLKKSGRDTSLADTIMSTYNAEKENTKAYYINTYGD